MNIKDTRYTFEVFYKGSSNDTKYLMVGPYMFNITNIKDNIVYEKYFNKQNKIFNYYSAILKNINIAYTAHAASNDVIHKENMEYNLINFYNEVDIENIKVEDYIDKLNSYKQPLDNARNNYSDIIKTEYDKIFSEQQKKLNEEIVENISQLFRDINNYYIGVDVNCVEYDKHILDINKFTDALRF